MIIAGRYASSSKNDNIPTTEDQLRAPIYLYRVKGFNSLVFDENGLNKLEKYEESLFTQEDCDKARWEGYQEGLNDAWEVARKIGDADRKLDKEFRNYLVGSKSGLVEELLSPAEAISKIKAYEEQKKEDEVIKVWDEVVLKGCVEPCSEERACVLEISRNDILVMLADGIALCIEAEDVERKTGRRFDIEGEGILKAMKEK